MNEAQRAVVAARMIPYHTEAAQKRMKAGKQADPLPNLAEGEKGAVRDVLAKLMNVSSGSVGNAARLLKQGCPELIRHVECGGISISAAADVSKLPEDEQKKIADIGKKAIQAKAKEIRENHRTVANTPDESASKNNGSRREPTSVITSDSSGVARAVSAL